MTNTTFMTRWLLALVLLAASGCHRRPGHVRDGEIMVAAASDLAFAFPELAARFERDTGTHVTFTFGSTGQLAKQIAEGAPYDVFAAANVTFVDEVTRAGACDETTEA